MEHLVIAYYLLVLLAGAAAITRAVLTARAHRLPFLKPFAFFLGFVNLAVLANLTSAYIRANLFVTDAQYEYTVYPRVLGTGSRLSQLGIVYALIGIAYGFRGRRPSGTFNVTAGLIAGLLLVSYVATGVLPGDSVLGVWIARGQLSVFYLCALAIMGILLGLLVGSRDIQSLDRRKAVRAFGVSYLSLYSIFVISRWLAVEGPFMPNAPALIAFNIVALMWLGKPFADAYLATPPSAEEHEAFERFCRTHSLTSREAGVLKLILRGRSNADIGKELFISAHTVKNHITNIYGKLGVRSRWQLISLFHSDPKERSLGDAPSPLC